MSKNSFSEQLRRKIESSATSRYEIARTVGISDSALSRFMSGERGLTLATFDKLVEVLGFKIVETVETLPRPANRGRKRTKDGPMTTVPTKREWQALAQSLARDAHEIFFTSRRGIWRTEHEGVLCLYNNNPYDKRPQLRAEELAEFKRRMKEEGIKELAYATYPHAGHNDAGYTYAMLISADSDKLSWALNTMTEILFRTNWEAPKPLTTPRQLEDIEKKDRG